MFTIYTILAESIRISCISIKTKLLRQNCQHRTVIRVGITALYRGKDKKNAEPQKFE